MPSSLTNKRKREVRHELNKVLKEHKYASTYPSYEPTEYELVFVNRITSIGTLISLDTKIKETNIFTLDTESIMRKFQPNVPALIQLQICSETSSIVIMVEVHHLPEQNKKEFQLIKNLFKSLFIKKNRIFIWGEIEELEKFIQFDLFNLQQIYSSTNRNIQREFNLYWEEVYPHHANPHEECQCKHCFGIDHNNLLSLQDAVAFELKQWLDKRLTCQSFNIGLDPKLRKSNPRELEYRKSLYTYAANDCDAINRIIIHSNIINDQYSESSPVNPFDDGILFREINNGHDDDEFADEDNDEIVRGDNGQVMIIGEPSLIIDSTHGPTPAVTTVINEPSFLEPISSDDEEPIDAQPSTHIQYINPLSEKERKKIHNRSRTIHQRTRAYAREIILYNIEKRFRVKMIKQMLKEHGVSITQVNPIKSKRTGQITLYIGIKEPVQVEKYEEIKELFTYKNYRRLFPHKFKRPTPRASEYGQRNCR